MERMRCPNCHRLALIRLPDDWQERVDHGEAIQVVGCGSPWHYANVELPPAVRDRLAALERVALNALDYLHHDGSGIKDPDPRWRGDYSAGQMLDARDSLRAALAAIGDGR